MRFYLFNSLCKLELAKFSLALSIQALLFSLIVRLLNHRMILQSSLAAYRQNKNSVRLYTYDARISCNNKETSIAIKNETDYDSLTVISQTKVLSLKSLILIPNPYQEERYFGISFLKSLFFETFRAALDFTEEETIPTEKNASKQIPLKSKGSAQSDLKNALCTVYYFSKSKCVGNNRWANWETNESDVSHQSHCQPTKPSEHSEVAIFAENYFVKLETVKAVASDNGFIRGNKYPTIKENLMAAETSTFEPMSEPNWSNGEHYSSYLKAEHATHCAAKEPQYTKTYKGYNTSKNVNLAFEKAKPKQTSPNIPDNFYLLKGELEKFKSIKVQKLPLIGKESKSLDAKNLRTEDTFFKLIWSIMLDDSNSDLQILEDEINNNSTDSSLLRNMKKLNTSHNSDYNKTYCCDNNLTPRKQSCFSEFTKEKEKASDVSEGLNLKAKRVRANSADSGVCLDSNFEEILPDSPSKESTSYEDASNEMNVCHEFVSGLSNSKPLYVDDCYKVCQLCMKNILNKFFLSSRFGLLLNCFHSFCYSCIRNHSKSKRFGTDPVRCPKCGKTSPGIVSSPRWIRDTHEKTVLFQKYEKESKFFSKQQQVFLNFVLV